MSIAFLILASMFAMVIAVFAIVYIGVPMLKGIGWLLTNGFKGIGWFIAHIFAYVAGTLTDIVRSVGAVIATVAFIPLVLLNVVIGRWSASAHFGRAVQDEVATFGHCIYRVAVGHPLRLLLLDGLVEGLEQRVPQAVANAPGSDRPSKRTGTFDGYTIVGSLKAGGSGGKLYVAEPDATKLAAFKRAGQTGVEQVVIKSFSLRDGSSMPQIVRESRALEAARKLGLILEHEMGDERFYYAMKYVPGDDLTAVTKRLHAPTGALGLTTPALKEAAGYLGDLLDTLGTFHKGGLWHKDVKPDNIIVHDGKAHLVDFGLITPLISGMTLTTHGTEYFRDPELVRMALRGAKVHEVEGEKFDIYGAGAVLYSVVENSFPAHGGLSKISKRCPEAIRWIVRRAMTDLNKRYPDTRTMLADLRAVQNAEDPFTLRPADLPSMRGEPVDGFLGYDEPDPEPIATPVAPVAAAPADEPVAVHAAHSPASFERPTPQAAPAIAAETKRTAPVLRVTDWMTGRYISSDSAETLRTPKPAGGAVRAAHAPTPPVRDPRGRLVPTELRAPASEQLKSARDRARTARDRAHARRRPGRHAHTKKRGRFSNEPNAGVIVAALFFFLGTGVLLAGGMLGFALLMPALESEGELFASDAPSIHFGEGFTLSTGGAEMVGSDVSFSTVTSGSGRTYTIESSDTSLGLIERLEHALDETTGRPMLILSDFTADDDGEALSTLMGIHRKLVSDGYTVLGLSSSERDLEFVAGAKKALGLSFPSDTDGREKLQRWLTRDGSDIGAVLWAHPEEEWQFVTPATLEIAPDDPGEPGKSHKASSLRIETTIGHASAASDRVAVAMQKAARVSERLHQSFLN